MKTMRKIAALLLALAMVFSLSLTAFADTDPDSNNTVATATITVNDNREYEVYQIFTGELHEGKLSNVKWGQNVKLPEGAVVGGPVTESLLDQLEGNAGEIVVIDRIAPNVNFESNPIGTVKSDKPLTVEVGYYLLKDVTNVTTLGDGEEYSRHIIKIIGDITVTPKVGTVSSNKKVKDRNDTTNNTSIWQDSADYDIGDDVPFRLRGVVSTTYDYYKSYQFIFHDTLSDGLIFNKDVKVYDGEDEISDAYYEVVTDCEDGCTFHVVLEDLKAIPTVAAGATIAVTYTAKLDDDAAIGSAGNPNSMYVEYSNNPSKEDSTGKTPTNTVKIFTYQLIVNKVDEAGAALEGAEFELYKKITASSGAGNHEELVDGCEIVGNVFTWKGLDDGTYILRETVTPDGYNTIDPIEFVVSAEHNTDSADPQLISLNGGVLGTGMIIEGKIETDVENRHGTTLPTTGGMGTTLIYAAGGILVLAAVVLLITKKRMADAK